MSISRSDEEIYPHHALPSDPSGPPPIHGSPLSDPNEPPPILSLSEEAAQARWERAFASITQKRGFASAPQKRAFVSVPQKRTRSTFEEGLGSRPGPKLARSRRRG